MQKNIFYDNSNDEFSDDNPDSVDVESSDGDGDITIQLC